MIYNHFYINYKVLLNKIVKEMLRFAYFLLTIFCFSNFNYSYALNSDWEGIEEAKVRIISPITKTEDNKNIFLGLEYKLLNGWKTYWHSPGEGGYPQKLHWENSKNIEKIEILWPKPKLFEILDLKSLGYENEIVFPLKVRLKDLNKSSLISLNLDFLTCKDICIPGNAFIELELNPGKSKLTKHSYKLEKYLSKTPLKNLEIAGLEIVSIEAINDNNSSIININIKSADPIINPKIYIGNNIGLPIVLPQYQFDDNYKTLSAKFFYDDIVFDEENLDFSFLISDDNFNAKYDIILKPKFIKEISTFNYSYIYIFFIALLGGLILNIMPCVLPVLSLKLLSIINHKEDNVFNTIRKSFIVTTFGIITSFILLALILIFLKKIGLSIGWGIQFQQPIFLMFISIVLFLFSINLLGFFEVSLPTYVNNFITKSFTKKTSFSDFFNGFFATLLATPCSAPFVGTAVSIAFTQSSFILITIFFFMGLGMSIPYIIASLFPITINFLPKPGNWMIVIKYFLAFLLFCTLIWIGFILGNHFNYIFFIFSIGLIALILLSIKYFKNFKSLIIMISIVSFFSLSYFPQLQNNKIINEKNWLDLNEVKINNLIEKNIVFVDITADWCATCQFNKYNVINSELITNIFLENNIIKVRGNWTKPNKKIQEYLNNFNRFGIPFNVMYSKNHPEGIILSELLTTNEIIKVIDKLKNN